MKQWSEIIRNVTMLSQLGLSLITPVLICLAVCWLIVSKTGAGGWVYIPGFFFGLGGSGTVAYKFYLSIIFFYYNSFILNHMTAELFIFPLYSKRILSAINAINSELVGFPFPA